MRVGSFSRVFFSKKPLRWSALEVSSLKHSSLSMRRFGGGMFRGVGGPPVSPGLAEGTLGRGPERYSSRACDV